METSTILRELGLNKYESSAYKTLLEEGILDANYIAKTGKIPIGKIYDTLTSLESKNLIEVQNTRPKKFLAKSPTIAFSQLKKQKEEKHLHEMEKFEKLTKELKNKIETDNNAIHKDNFFWSTIVGEENALKVFNTTLQEAKEEIIIVMNKHATKDTRYTKLAPKLAEHLKDQFLKNKTKVKIIEPNSNIRVPQLIKKEAKRLIARKQLVTDYNFWLIDSKTIIIPIQNPLTLTDPIALLKIHDIELGGKMKTKFNELWRNAKASE